MKLSEVVEFPTTSKRDLRSNFQKYDGRGSRHFKIFKTYCLDHQSKENSAKMSIFFIILAVIFCNVVGRKYYIQHPCLTELIKQLRKSHTAMQYEIHFRKVYDNMQSNLQSLFPKQSHDPQGVMLHDKIDNQYSGATLDLWGPHLNTIELLRTIVVTMVELSNRRW